jgi:hypothetical protein
MKIINDSIKNFGWGIDVFYELACKISATAPVGLTVRSFSYELTDSTDFFALEDFRLLFKELLPSCEIVGTLEKASYEKSEKMISDYIYCGSLAGDFLASRSDISPELREQSEKNLEHFWNEVGKIFTLPPTHVYMHEAAYGSCFAEGSIWNFCFIYLNDVTKEGIVLAGDCDFD